MYNAISTIDQFRWLEVINTNSHYKKKQQKNGPDRTFYNVDVDVQYAWLRFDTARPIVPLYGTQLHRKHIWKGRSRE